MQRLSLACIGAALVALLAGCSATSADESVTPPVSELAEADKPASPTPLPSSEGSCPSNPIEVVITYELLPDAGGGTIVEAETNLPEGSEVNGSFFIENEFLAQDEDVVEGGRARFGPFSDDGEPLRGTYELSITLPIARNQPASVQACIGEAGELLTGPLVSTEEITGDKVASLDELVTFS